LQTQSAARLWAALFGFLRLTAPAGSSGFASGPWLEEIEAAGFDQSPPDDWDLGA
jgi:hypothetical protein